MYNKALYDFMLLLVPTVNYTRQGKATVFGIYFAALLKNDFFIFV